LVSQYLIDKFNYRVLGRDSISNIYNSEILDNKAGEEILAWTNSLITELVNDDIPLNDRKQNLNKLWCLLRFVYDVIYKENGHILGHYFRNMFYILDTIDNFACNDSQKKYYAKIFRAQLSRYEIALTILNALSSQSNREVIRLIKKYDILNGFYYDDLEITKFRSRGGIINEQIRIKGKQSFIADILDCFI